MESLFAKIRDIALEDHRSRRQQIIERTRKLLDYEKQSDSHEQMQDVEGPTEIPKSKKAYRRERAKSKLFQVADWLNAIPTNLQEFYVMSRPNTTRALLSFEDTKLLVLDKQGRTIKCYHLGTNQWNHTILEGYFSEEHIFVSDVLVWKQQPMSCNEFEFRWAWIQANLNLQKLRQYVGPSAISMVCYFPCNSQGLIEVYSQKGRFEKEGLLLVHKDSFYVHGLNHNALIWKDPETSAYFHHKHKKGYCKLTKQGTLYTLDDVCIGRVAQQDGGFLKFTFGSIMVSGEQVVLQGLDIIEVTKYQRQHVDPFSKLLFHSAPINISFKQLHQKTQLQMQTE